MDFRHIAMRAAIGLALAIPIVALAQSRAVPVLGGGAETLAQYEQRGEQKLMAADTDGDGRVSRAEFVAAEAGHGDPSSRFARLDANGDGMIDRSEIDAMLVQRFRRLDTNGDGVLSVDERAAMHRHRPDSGKDDAPGAPSD